MKKYIFAVLGLLFAVSSARATPFGDFHSLASGATLKPFALDLGGILGGSAFHSGRAIGFPGFDVGVVGTIQFHPDKNDLILRGPGVKAFGIPLVQAEIGLPHNVDVIAHGVTGEGASILGAGLRYGIHKSGVLSVMPDIAVSAFGDRVNQTYFSSTHYSLNAVASFHMPVVHPFIGLGMDVTKIKVGSATLPANVGITQTATGSRASLGVDISPLPFAHIYGAYTLLHGLPGADIGVGVRF